jgi:hypothetical protein
MKEFCYVMSQRRYLSVVETDDGIGIFSTAAAWMIEKKSQGAWPTPNNMHM